MNVGVFQGREVTCSRGHTYVRPLDAPDGLPCPTCAAGAGPYWRVAVMTPALISDLWTAAATVAASLPVAHERLFKRVRVTHLAGERVRSWMPPRYQWMPGWVEEGARA